jgi:hypothetical protein
MTNSLIKSLLRVQAFSQRDKWQKTQVLEKVWTLFGWPIWTKEIDREEIPAHVLIELGAMGSTDWKSKWSGRPEVWWSKYNGNQLTYYQNEHKRITH